MSGGYRGPPPKPTWLKLVAGNPGRRPLNDAEPVLVGTLDAPLEWLTEAQKELWRGAVAACPPGMLASADASVLAAWCVAVDLHKEASQKVAQYGAVIKAPHSGVPMQSPYLIILTKQHANIIRAAAELGFTPSSRSRVRVDTGGKGAAGGKFGGLKDPRPA